MQPHQPILKEYPASKSGNQIRRFNASWFDQFSWLEYSPSTDKAYCFTCFVFNTNPPKHPAFTVDGFKSREMVNDKNKCPFVQHVGVPCSHHMSSVRSCEDLMNPSRSINKVLNAQEKEEVLNNQLCLNTTIEIIRWLALQGCAFRSHDESLHFENAGNFKELLKLFAKFNPGVVEVLKIAPKNAMYTSPDIQKQVLNLLAEAVRKNIRKEVGNNKLCIIIDEAQDISNQEQMAIILRFLDDNGFFREQFFGVVGVKDTNALTLKKEISDVLARYSLQIENMRGQWYDGASNMHGAWNSLQALFLKECPYAYYVHYFAHRLQLALVASSKDVHNVWLFFSQLSSIVNLIAASPNCIRPWGSLMCYVKLCNKKVKTS